MAIDAIVIGVCEQPSLSLSRMIETPNSWQVESAKIAYAAMLHKIYIHRKTADGYVNRRRINLGKS